MALTGLQIFKLLPKTNCKECGFPTCLAFAMKLAAKQAELAACPYVSDEATVQLESAAAPPFSSDFARYAGSKFSRIKPFEGDAFFSSEMIRTFSGSANACRNDGRVGAASAAAISSLTGTWILSTSSAVLFFIIISSKIVILID